MIYTPMFWLYLFFVLFFAAVLVGVGKYEFRRADQRRKEERIAQRLKSEAARASGN